MQYHYIINITSDISCTFNIYSSKTVTDALATDARAVRYR